jgi:hypothetical protein
MKKLSAFVLFGMLGAPGTMLGADESVDIEALRRELRELRQRTEQLERKLQSLPAAVPTMNVGETNLVAAARKEIPPPSGDEPPRPATRWSPADPIRVFGGGLNYVNLSLDSLFAVGSSTADDLNELQPGGHDPTQRGFTVQNVELVLDGAVDPYFRGQGNLIFFIDRDGETQVELEEAYLESMSLPANLQLRAGQFFTEFGRQNPTHPHAWSFVDAPLVNARFLGPDGLRNPGARLSWLAPTPFYSELFLAVQNSHGETASSFRSAGHGHGGEEEEEELPFAFRHPDNDRGFHGFEDFLLTPRYALSFDLTDSQVLLLGASAAFGPNSRGGEASGDTDTQVYGADLTWKWKSPRHSGGFPFVMFQTEAMLRKYKAGGFDWDEDGDGAAGDGEVVDAATGLPAVIPGETLTDHGFYAQLLYGFRKGWVAGVRGDFVTSDEGAYERMALSLNGEPLGRDPMRAERWRLSPNLTWYPTEFSKFRLQYNYDKRSIVGDDHSVWLQFEFLLGSHGAHKF